MTLPLPRILTHKEGQPINWDGTRIQFMGDADIDCDGSGGNPDKDKYFQPDTTLHVGGKALNAYKVPFIVLPPDIIKAVPGIVLGCMAQILNTRNGMFCTCVVGDVGPRAKIGEISVAAAKRIGVNSNPVHGGEEDFVIEYTVWPGRAALIDGVQYKLQKYGA